MTITIQENTDISLKNDIKKITQIQNVTASLSGQDSSKKAKLPYKGDYVEKVLSDIIISSKGKPDRLAIMLYSFLKSWFKPNSNRKFNKSGKFDIRKYGYRTSYEQLAKEFKCSEESIRQKIVLLEKFGLLNRNFRIEYEGGVRKNNVLYLLLWKDTLYFEFEHGLEKRQIFKPSINKGKWEEIAKNETGGSPKILGEGVQENLDSSPKNKGGGPQKFLDIIISNTTPLLHSNTTPEELKLSTRVLCSSNKDSTINTSSEIRTRDPIQKNPQGKHATFAPCNLAELEQVATLGMKESVTATIANQRNKLQEVQQALRNILGERKAEEIRVHCEIIELEPDKVGIYTGALPINDIDKVKIRQALKSVYGNNVQITKIDTRPSEQHEQEEISKDIPPNILPQYDWSKKATWKDFRISIINNSKNPFSLTAIFNMPMLKVTEELGRVIIESEPNLIDQLSSPIWYLEDMERAVLETGLTLELKVDNNHSECKDIPQKVVVLAPEEIIEKIKLAWSKKQEEQKNYEIFKSRYGNVIQNAKT